MSADDISGSVGIKEVQIKIDDVRNSSSRYTRANNACVIKINNIL